MFADGVRKWMSAASRQTSVRYCVASPLSDAVDQQRAALLEVNEAALNWRDVDTSTCTGELVDYVTSYAKQTSDENTECGIV